MSVNVEALKLGPQKLPVSHQQSNVERRPPKWLILLIVVKELPKFGFLDTNCLTEHFHGSKYWMKRKDLITEMTKAANALER